MIYGHIFKPSDQLIPFLCVWTLCQSGSGRIITVVSRYPEIVETFKNKSIYQSVEILVAVILGPCLLFTSIIIAKRLLYGSVFL